MPPTTESRRSFLRAAAGAAAAASLGEAWAAPGAGGGRDLLIAYVGTYSAPLHDVRPSQVDLVVFRVSRRTGELKFTEQCVPVGNPSQIVFLDLGKRP